MIYQILLDFVAELMAAFIILIPPAPPEMSQALNAIGAGMESIAQIVSKLGPIMPWDTFGVVVQWWLGSLIFFAACLVIRVVLFAIGR